MRFLLFVFALLLAVPAHAQTDPYSASVSVDVTAESAASARERAMEEASKRALLAVLKRTSTEAAVEKVSSLETPQLMNFISETDVLSETSSPTRYIATLKIVINKDLLKAYLEEQGMKVASDSPAEIIIIPVLKDQKTNAKLLWQKDNIWYEAWAGKIRRKGLYTFKTVSGKNHDLIDADQAIYLDGIALNNVSQNYYGNKNIYVLEFSYIPEGYNVGISSMENGFIKNIRIPEKKDGEIFDSAIEKSILEIDDLMRQNSISTTSSKSDISVLYNYQTMKDWLEIEQKLKQTPSVENLAIDAIGNGKVQFKLTLTGGLEGLQRALSKNYLSLEDRGSIYLLERK